MGWKLHKSIRLEAHIYTFIQNFKGHERLWSYSREKTFLGIKNMETISKLEKNHILWHAECKNTSRQDRTNSTSSQMFNLLCEF